MNRSAIGCALASAADPATTVLAVRAGAAEGHPLWAAAIDGLGLGPAMTLRLLIGVMLVAAIAVAVEHDGNPLTGWTLRVLTVLFSLVALWNLVAWVTA